MNVAGIEMQELIGARDDATWAKDVRDKQEALAKAYGQISVMVIDHIARVVASERDPTVRAGRADILMVILTQRARAAGREE